MVGRFGVGETSKREFRVIASELFSNFYAETGFGTEGLALEGLSWIVEGATLAFTLLNASVSGGMQGQSREMMRGGVSQ